MKFYNNIVILIIYNLYYSIIIKKPFVTIIIYKICSVKTMKNRIHKQKTKNLPCRVKFEIYSNNKVIGVRYKS